MSILYRRYDYSEKYNITKDLEPYTAYEDGEEPDEKEQLEPIFNPRTFFKKNERFSLKDYELDNEEAKLEGLVVIKLREQIRERES